MNQQKQPSPELFLQAVNAYRDSAVVKGAVELDVFTAIAQGVNSADALAGHCQADKRGMRSLCDYLCVMGMLEKTDKTYLLTPDSAVFLDRNSPAFMGDIVNFLLDPFFVRDIGDVARAVRKGGVATSAVGSDEPDHPMWVTFARSMTGLNRKPAMMLADHVRMNEQEQVKVLDIAAGSGIFGITLGEKYPQAGITAVDWPNVLEVAKENAEKAGISDRYKTIPGSAFEVEVGDGYQVILLCNFLHHFDAPTCSAFLLRMKGALATGGKIYVLDFVPDEDRISPPFAVTFSMQMLRQTVAGDVYTSAEYKDIFAAAELQVDETVPLPATPYTVIVASHK